MSGHINDISYIGRRRHNILWRKIEEDHRFNGKKRPKRKKIIDISAGQHGSMRYSALSKMSLFCAIEGIRTPNKSFGIQLIKPPGQTCPLLNVLH